MTPLAVPRTFRSDAEARALPSWLRFVVPVGLTGTLVWLAIAIGLVTRVGWAGIRRVSYASAEAANVAVSLAEGRGFADAFAPGSGPTAHLMPLPPLIAATVYRLLGVRTAASELVLLGWSLLLTFACYLLFGKSLERLGSPRAAVRGGFVLLAALPVYTRNDAFDFRVWDGALGLALGGIVLLLIASAEHGVRPRRFPLWLGGAAALTFFVHPVVGLASFAAIALFLWRGRGGGSALNVAMAALLGLAVLFGPWTARNWVTMGQPIVMRDNLGLELAVANYPEAVSGKDMRNVFRNRMIAVHPYDHPQAYAAFQRAGGEIGYSQRLKRETLAWMKANPGAVARIWTRHVREMLFTRSWMFPGKKAPGLMAFRSTTVTLLALLAIGGLLLALRRRDGRYLYPALYVVVPVLCYVPFQPIPRYSWLIYPALAFLAADFVVRMWAGTQARRAGGTG